MITVTSWTSLVLLTIAVSQPLFYWLALGRATRQLSPTSYVELRQRINAAVTRRLTRLYIATLLSLLTLLTSAAFQAAWSLMLGAGIAAIALTTDALLATRLNVFINARMDAWSLSEVPNDWQLQRAHWDRAFAIRRVVLLAGLVQARDAAERGRSKRLRQRWQVGHHGVDVHGSHDLVRGAQEHVEVVAAACDEVVGGHGVGRGTIDGGAVLADLDHPIGCGQAVVPGVRQP